MTVAQIAANIVPPPRRPVTLLTILPLAAFLVLFLGTAAALELTDTVFFSSPWAFALTAAAPWFWWFHVAGYGGLRGVRALGSLAVRLLVVAAFVLVLADPRAVRKSTVLSVVYALDLSDSVSDSTSNAALEYIVRTASEKPERDEAGLVVFGREAVVELPPRVSFPFEAINSRIDRDGTNIEKGLSLAAAMLPDDHQGRVVLVSDGAATEGSVSRVLDDLNARSIPVDVLPLTYDYDHEVWLEKLEVPRTVKIGENYKAIAILSSLKAGSGLLTLRENGEVVARKQVDFEAGKNRFAMPLYLRAAGFYEYVATIDVPKGKDNCLKNNIAVNHILLKGKGRVLVVTEPGGEDRDWKPLAEALRRGQRLVVQQPAFEFPREAFSLMPFDCIIFVNVPADAFDAVQLEALRAAVYHQGSGFLMVGGKNSFGPGGYHRTPVELALPVTMDVTQKKVLPKGALAIILHTCEFAEGNTWGKRIAKEAIRVLGARDEVGLLAYGMGGEGWIFKLTPAGDYEKLVPLINKATIGDMPSFANTMKLGVDALKASDAGMKHMIIISDGDPSPPPPPLLAEFKKSEVSVSTVAVFPHSGPGGPETALMRRIASATGGRFYHPQDPRRLPSIFIKEAKTLKRSMIQNKDFVPQVEFPSAVLAGIDPIPLLHGLVLTTPKSRAATILRVPEVEDVDPVLATWRYGVGKSAAFTSDLSTNWGAEWVRSPHFRPFVTQLITDIARATQEGSLRIQSYAEAGMGTVVVDDYHAEASFLEVTAQVAGPRGKALSVPLKQVGPRRYRGEFPIWGNGHYHVSAAGVGAGRKERVLGRFVVPYSPEYLRFRSNPLVLQQILSRTGGKELTGDETGPDIFVKDREPKVSSQSIADWFLLVLACLIPLDVAVRRVQIDWGLIASWLRGKRGTSGATLGALLQRKKAITMPSADRRPLEPTPPEAQPLRPTAPAAPAPRTAAPKPKPTRAPTPVPEEPPADGVSTTSRLLQMKKKWQKK